MKNIALTDENFKNLETIIEYLLDSERKNYEESVPNTLNEDDIFEEYFYNNIEIKHIYAITMRLKNGIKTVEP